MMRALSTAIALTGLVTLASALIAGQSRAHDAPTGWRYSALCCSNRDCRQDDNAASVVKDGWMVRQTGEVIPWGDSRIKDAPDGLTHICMSAADFESANAQVLCLYVPPMGF